MASPKEPSGCARVAFGFEAVCWGLMLVVSVVGTLIGVSDDRPGPILGMGIACVVISLVGAGLAVHALKRGRGLFTQGGLAAALSIARVVIGFFPILGIIVVGVMGVTA